MKNSKVIRLDVATVLALDRVRELQESRIGELMKKYDIPSTSDNSFILAGLLLLEEKYLNQEV